MIRTGRHFEAILLTCFDTNLIEMVGKRFQTKSFEISKITEE